MNSTKIDQLLAGVVDSVMLYKVEHYGFDVLTAFVYFSLNNDGGLVVDTADYHTTAKGRRSAETKKMLARLGIELVTEVQQYVEKRLKETNHGL